jgi:hypothetical protein
VPARSPCRNSPDGRLPQRHVEGRPAASTVALSPVAATEAWRAKHETDYRRDWASIAGLYPLKAGTNTAGSARTNDIVLPASAPATVGAFVLNGKAVRFEPAPGATVLKKTQPVTAPTACATTARPNPTS